MATTTSTQRSLTVRQRVARGIALLNKRLPGWKREINPSTLNMARDNSCILGQLFGSYMKGTRVMKIARPSQYGFEKNAFDSGYTKLREEWLRKLGHNPDDE